MGVVADAMLSRVLEEAVNRIARKVAEGKKLSDQEIVILYLDIITRSNEKRFETIDKRFNDLREYTDKRFESLEKRIEDLRSYVDKRINDLKEDFDKKFEAVDKRLDTLDKRIDSLERRVELVYNEVSSIKTDII
jgi:chaperonin cofactor prefoldin